MNPLRTVSDALSLPFKAVGVVAVCVVINLMTTPGHWWVQWVALGMGIAVLSAWWRAVKLVGATALLAGAAALFWPRLRKAGGAAPGAHTPPPAPAAGSAGLPPRAIGPVQDHAAPQR